MLRKTPKTFNAVDVILAAIGKGLAVVQAVVFPQPFQGVVAPECVGVVDRPLPGFLPDDGHQFFLGHMLYDSRIHLAIAFQKPKYNVFACCAPSALPLASAAKVALVHLHLAVQFAALELGDMVDCFTETLVDAGNCLVVYAQVVRKAVRRLLLIEALDNGYLRPDTLQRFLFSTDFLSTADIPSLRLRDRKRTAENALSTPQKVGRTIENVLSLHNQAILYHVLGYESH